MRPLWPFFSASNYATDSLCLLKGECLHATQSRRCFSPRAHCVNKKQAEPMFEKFNRRDSSAEDSTSLEINFQSQQQQAGEPIKQGTTGPGGNNNPERACTWARTHIHTHTATLCSHCFPVPWLRIMAWKRTIRQRQTRGGFRSRGQSPARPANTAQLAGPESAHTAGPRLA